MRRSRAVVLLAVLAIAASPLLAGAAPAPKPQVMDPKGDARLPEAGFDILSAGLKTTGTTKKLGKRTVYTPTRLVATVTLAGPPPTIPGTNIEFRAAASACKGGDFTWTYHAGPVGPFDTGGDLFVSGCGDTGSLGTQSATFGDVIPVIKGNAITWTFRLKDLGSELPLGSTFRNFRVSTDISEPVLYFAGTNTVDTTSIDLAVNNSFWDLA